MVRLDKVRLDKKSNCFFVVDLTSQLCCQTKTDDPYHAAMAAESFIAHHQQRFPHSLKFVFDPKQKHIYEVLELYEHQHILNDEDHLHHFADHLQQITKSRTSQEREYFTY